ncbi:MAG TPA: hypothetical protein VFX30_01900 [bacterium]|nr:hypothetical protein [bacterium]
MMPLPLSSLAQICAGVPAFAGATMPSFQSRTILSVSNDDGLTGGGPGVAVQADEGPFIIDGKLLRDIADQQNDGELRDLLDRLDEISGRFLEHATKQLDALKAGKTAEAKKQYDLAMELSLPWQRLMKDIHEHSKKKGY